MDALSTPVFKKKKPSSRANGASSEAADPSSPSAAGDVSFDMADLDQDDSPGAAIAAARAARIKKKKAGGTAGGSASKTKAKSKLSFGGDEEEDVSGPGDALGVRPLLMPYLACSAGVIFIVLRSQKVGPVSRHLIPCAANELALGRRQPVVVILVGLPIRAQGFDAFTSISLVAPGCRQ